MACASMIDSAAPTRVAARSYWLRSVAMAASPLMANGRVNWSPIRTQISSASRSSACLVEVPELPFHHAEVRGLGRNQELVPASAHHGQALGHPVTRFPQVAGDLGTDAQQVERIRAAGFVIRRLADRQRFRSQPPTLNDIRAQCHARQATQGLRDHRSILEFATDLQPATEMRRRGIVIAHPERHEAGEVVGRSPPTHVTAAGLQDPVEPLGAFSKGLLRDPVPIHRDGQPQRLIDPALVQEPRHGGQQLLVAPLELRECGLAIGPA
jgi:hypothetical protein